MPLRFAIRSIACLSLLGACSSVATTVASGSGPSPGSTSPDGGQDAPADAGVLDGDTGAGMRLGPERLADTVENIGNTDPTLPLARLVCPRGSLVVGLDVAYPDQDAGVDPSSADRFKVVCATVGADGSLGPAASVDNNNDFDGLSSFRSLRCPSGLVATRIVGASQGMTFTTLGLLCDAPPAIADGAAIGAGTASQPATLGVATATTFDDPCPSGSALDGFALHQYASSVTPGLATGFFSVQGLCRDVLLHTVPGGGPRDPSRPIGLGAMAPVAALSLTSAGLPAPTYKRIVDCPDGAIATGFDVGRTPSSGPSGLIEIGLNCRPLGVQGELGADAHEGLSPAGVRGECLEGSAITGLRFTKLTLGDVVDVAEDATGECAIAAPGPRVASSLPYVTAPGFPDLTTPPWEETTCPSGSVIAGVELWTGAADAGDTVLGGIGLRCRAIERP
jgi:hypothetical protein